MLEPGEVRIALRSMPLTTIADFVEGVPARVVGRVAPGPHLIAPLSGRPCVYYEVLVIEQDGFTRELVHDVLGVPFTLEDHSGRALVELGYVIAELEDQVQTSSGMLDDPTQPEEAFLYRHGLSGYGGTLNRSLTYHEAVIAPGRVVAIAGRGVREPDPDPPRHAAGLYRGMPTRLRINGSARAPLLISDALETLR